jgi:eukaryotic-like serine/threonine-protein kinase
LANVPVSSPPSGEEARFGKYRLLQHLASGGMAHIFLATMEGPGGFAKQCVIKRILPEYARLESFSRMFADEAKIAALLTHPNIVQVFDFGQIDGQYYLAMEWIQGQSLDRVMKHAWTASLPLGPRMAVSVGLAISEALDYAHAKTLPDGTPLRLVHRDVTPGNMLVSREGIIKLADFGIVKTAVNHERTVAGVVKGNYAYMAPEQISGRELDHRSDLFSLGVVLYEVSVGRRLFKRDSTEATLFAASQAQVPLPSEVVPGFPPEFERILLRLLARSPEARYPSARELHEDLEEYRSSQSWTSGGRHLAALMATLFPPDKSGHPATAVPAPGSRPGSSSVSSRTPSGPSGSRPAALQEPADEGTSPDIDIALAEQRFPWWVAVAAAIAVIGSALFWYLVA